MSDTVAYSKLESDSRFASKGQLEQVKEVIDNISVSGGKMYATLALANADIADIAQNERVEIYADINEENNGIWTKDESNVLVFVRKIDEIVNNVFENNFIDNGIIQTTATGDTNTSVSSIHGLSVAIGIVPNPFNKVIFHFAQNIGTPVTQIEIRLFQGKVSGGTLIVKKRVSFTAITTVQASVEILLDSIIDYDGEMWFEVLTNAPFAYKKVLPATLRTAALGYGQPRVTTVNNLDGTTFATTQTYCDARLDFNTIVEEIGLTEEGTDIVLSASTEVVDINITGSYTGLNSYLTNTGVVITSTNWRTSELIPVTEGNSYKYFGKTNQTGVAMGMVGYDVSNNPTVLVGNSDYSIVPAIVLIPSGIINVRVCGFHLTPPLLISPETKIKEDLLPVGLSPNDKLKIDLTWNCVGHSIWQQDNVVYPNTSVIARGFQTLIQEIFSFSKYNKYCYSGRSLGATTPTGDNNSITSFFSDWVDNSDGFWTLDTITNDFKRDIPIGVLSDYTNNTGIMTYYGALRAFKDKVESLTPNSIVITSNATKRDNDGYTSTSINEVGATLADYEFALMTICQINNWWFIDQFRKSEIEDSTLSITTRDGLHLNNFGYSLAFKPWLESIWIIYRNSKIN